MSEAFDDDGVVTSAPPPAAPLLPADEADLLDIAAVLSLVVPGGPEKVDATLEQIEKIDLKTVEGKGQARRARLSSLILNRSDEISRRLDIKALLEHDLKTRGELVQSRGETANALALLELELESKRVAAEEKRYADAIAVLGAEEREAIRAARLSAEEAFAREQQIWAANNAVRAEALDALRQERDAVRAREKSVFDREEALRRRSISKTVAGYLLWLGYASVVGTGTVVAFLMSPGSVRFDLLIMGWRNVIESLPGPLIMRLVAATGLFAGALSVIGLAVWLCDRFLSRSGGWLQGREQSESRPVIRLGPPVITRRSHFQLVATFPFLLAIGMVLTCLAAAPGANTANGITTLLPTVGYTFIGTVIAFLATAIFIMYVVQVIEPRIANGASSWRAAWEFAVLPLFLLAAVMTTAVLLWRIQGADNRLWLPWAAVMLVSSLSLACGIVYHGVFKDADKLREALQSIENDIHALNAPPRLSMTERQAVAVAKIEKRYAARLADLHAQRATVRNRNGRMPPAQKHSGNQRADFRRWIQKLLGVGNVAAPLSDRETAPEFTATDYEVDRNLIERIHLKRMMLARLDEETRNLDVSITANKHLISWDAMNTLIAERDRATGEREASKFDDVVAASRAEAESLRLRLRVRATTEAAAASKPSVDGVRAEVAEEMKYLPVTQIEPDDVQEPKHV